MTDVKIIGIAVEKALKHSRRSRRGIGLIDRRLIKCGTSKSASKKVGKNSKRLEELPVASEIQVEYYPVQE